MNKVELVLSSGGQAWCAVGAVPSLRPSASLIRLGDAIHLLWVVLGPESTLLEAAEGSGVWPTELCPPWLLGGSPGHLPAMGQETGGAGGL